MFTQRIISARKPLSTTRVLPPVEEFKHTALALHQLHETEYGSGYLEATLLCFLAVDSIAIDHPGSVTIQNNINSIYALIDELMQSSGQPDVYYQALHQSIRSLSAAQLLSCIIDTQGIYSQLRRR